MRTFYKDPDATLDYVWDWTDWLGNDTISSFTITPPNIELVVEGTPTELNGVITAFLTGGVLNKSYKIVCKILTNGGRTEDRSIRLIIKQK
jgi:hypothetical protein